MSDPELSAMQKIFEILDPLDDGARERVLAWVAQRLSIGSAPSLKGQREPTPHEVQTHQLQESPGSIADLFHAVSPSTNADKALTVGYWLQVCQGHEHFPSQAVNKELQNLGHALGNVTDAFKQLQNKRPALAIQVKKSGRSQQARKQYKLTQAGIDVINAKARLEIN